MRGKLFTGPQGSGKTRITPAHAGKTFNLPIRRTADQDHPRACGENLHGLLIKPCPVGSPPRMRGKHYNAALVRKLLRITPAHAGKTAVVIRSGMLTRDHPRACGENTKKIL